MTKQTHLDCYRYLGEPYSKRGHHTTQRYLDVSLTHRRAHAYSVCLYMRAQCSLHWERSDIMARGCAAEAQLHVGIRIYIVYISDDAPAKEKVL